MPTVICHECETATTLPANWSKASYMCPHCMATVTPDDAPPPGEHVQPAATGDAFGTMFKGAIGGSLGCVVAVVILALVVITFCAGVRK